MKRRSFIAAASGCAAYATAMLAMGTSSARRTFAARPAGKVVVREPWGRIEELAEGAWALVSTPFGDHPDARLTVANGGIVAGSNGVAIVEGLYTPEGATWLAEAAEELTGRRPDHVVLSHYHSDHASGLSAYGGSGLVLHASETTLSTLEDAAENAGRQSAVAAFSGNHLNRVEEESSTSIDLGNRRLEVRATSGHTDSDLYVVLEDPSITWCGDLVWNGVMPNYVDTAPSRFTASVRRLARETTGTWVPGHGDIADRHSLDRYMALVDDLEDKARRSFDQGTSAEAAASDYRPPETLGELALFSPGFYEVAFRAWYRELGG